MITNSDIVQYHSFSFGVDNTFENSFDITAMIPAGLNLPEEQIIVTAARWVLQNRKNYRFSSTACGNLMKALENAVNQGSVQEQSIALNAFFEGFFNNPYLYEHCSDAGSLKEKIASNRMQCYSVILEGIQIPLGVLPTLVGPVLSQNIMGKYLMDRNEQFDRILTGNIDYSQKYEKHYISNRKQMFSHFWRMLAGILILLVSVNFITGYLICGISWADFAETVKYGGNLFQIIGFLTQKSYGFHHNGYLNTICVVISLLWLWFVLYVPHRLWGEWKAFSVYRNRDILNSCGSYLYRHLIEMQSKKDTRIRFILDQLDSLEYITLKLKRKKTMLQYADFLNQTPMPKAPDPSMRRLMPSRGLVLLFILAILTVGLHHHMPGVLETFDSTLQKLSIWAEQNRGLVAEKKYTVGAATPLYSHETQGEAILYEINPGDMVSLVYEEDSAEEKKARVMTGYGYVSGWLRGASLTNYIPPEEVLSQKAPVSEVNASSSTSKKGTQRINDGKAYTMWAEDGENGAAGEFVEYCFEKSVPVTALMLQTGNATSDWSFSNSSRPLSMKVEFFDGEVSTQSLNIRLDDTRDQQYLYLNKPVKANKVRFIIDEFATGSFNKSVSISELWIYQKPEA